MKVEFGDLAVFTRDGQGGNPLAVVPFDRVPSDRWLETARAIGYSETVFVEDADPAVVHIYTPGRRIPFAGHPLVGSAFALPRAERIRFDTGWAAVSRDGEVAVTVDIDCEVEETTPPGFAKAAFLVEMPLPYLIVEVDSPADVSGLAADTVADLGHAYFWAWEGDNLVRARFFAADLGVPEDPATGSAAVALARTMVPPSGEITVHQGEEMGSPSLIRLSWKGKAVTIGGTVGDRGTGIVDLVD